jgi:hypothetical protein
MRAIETMDQITVSPNQENAEVDKNTFGEDKAIATGR